LLRCATAQFHSREKKATVGAIAFFMELRCSVTPQHVEESCRRLLRGVALQRSSKASRRRQRQLPSPSSWRCATAQLHSRKKKVTAAIVAFFFLFFLRCTKKKATIVAVAFFVALQHSSTAWRCTTTHLHSRKKKATATAVTFFFFFLRCTKKKKKATAVAVAFFVELRCDAATAP